MHRSCKVTTTLVAMILGTGAGERGVQADETLKGIACRSVHLQYPAPEAVVFYNEVTVDRSAPGTYFCVCGFGRGYFGLQELADGGKVVLFSVWDPGSQNDPDAVAPGRRVQVLHAGEEVRVGRFGNEGTGGQAFLDLDWQLGQTHRFLVRAIESGERTAFEARLFLPDRQEWFHLVTFSTPAAGRRLDGYYSFVEDFRRNRVSATIERRARFGNGWIRRADGAWIALTRARFTADSNPVTNIDAGRDGSRFFLATGGETRNDHTALGDLIDRPPGDIPQWDTVEPPLRDH